MEHLIPLLPHLKEFVDAVNDKTVKNVSKSPSFNVLETELRQLDLIRAKLEFFAYTATELEPFLREFQTNKPYAPFLYDRLRSILTTIIGRFVKSHVKLDPKKESNCLPNKEVQIGFGAQRAVAKAVANSKYSTSSGLSVTFRKEAKEIMQVIVSKIQDRSPLKYGKVKALSALSPSLVRSDPLESSKRFKNLCSTLLDANRINTTSADKALRQWESIV